MVSGTRRKVTRNRSICKQATLCKSQKGKLARPCQDKAREKNKASKARAEREGNNKETVGREGNGSESRDARGCAAAVRTTTKRSNNGKKREREGKG